jgi:hypothetical protein
VKYLDLNNSFALAQKRCAGVFVAGLTGHIEEVLPGSELAYLTTYCQSIGGTNNGTIQITDILASAE